MNSQVAGLAVASVVCFTLKAFLVVMSDVTVRACPCSKSKCFPRLFQIGALLCYNWVHNTNLERVAGPQHMACQAWGQSVLCTYYFPLLPHRYDYCIITENLFLCLKLLWYQYLLHCIELVLHMWAVQESLCRPLLCCGWWGTCLQGLVIIVWTAERHPRMCWLKTP
jgi:hypothetical protein